MWSLKLRMWLLVGILFGIIYMAVTIIGVKMGITNFYFYLALSFVLMFIQHLLGPKIVELIMRVKYITKDEYPRLFEMV